MKTDTITELIAGYEAYADSTELKLGPAAEAPATTVVCGAAGVSWLASQFSARTVNGGC